MNQFTPEIEIKIRLSLSALICLDPYWFFLVRQQIKDLDDFVQALRNSEIKGQTYTSSKTTRQIQNEVTRLLKIYYRKDHQTMMNLPIDQQFEKDIRELQFYFVSFEKFNFMKYELVYSFLPKSNNVFINPRFQQNHKYPLAILALLFLQEFLQFV